MLFIDKNSAEVQTAHAKHWEYYKCRIRKKIGEDNCTPTCKVCTHTRKINDNSPRFDQIIQYLLEDNNLEDIISGDAENLLTHNTEFYNHLTISPASLTAYFDTPNDDKPALALHPTIKIIRSIFNYSDFTGADANEYGAYKMALNLKRRTCTYCNRVYTNTMSTRSGQKVMRPQYDHWYPNSRFPLLAISFYNLIPSCYICNSSSKSDIILDKDFHIHPYIDSNQSDEFRFNYAYRTSIDQYRISIVPTDINNKKAHDTLKKLSVDEMYNAHHEELRDLIKIKQAYSDEYISKMQKFFPKSGLSQDETYRLIFGAELENHLLHMKPLSKFKRDILKRLGIIS
jgi:intein-encoded DNA endonuclease-like protein